MSNQNTVTREECEAILKIEFNTEYVGTLKRLARAHLELFARCGKAEHDLACWQIDHSKCEPQKELLRSQKAALESQLAEARKALAKKYDDDIGPWDIIHEIESAIDAAGALRAKPEGKS